MLRREDEVAWESWQRAALAHSRTLVHRRRVESAQRHLEAAVRHGGAVGLWWSGGKDSTVLTHLAAQLHAPVRYLSVKDDMDYPGEESYVRELAESWGVRVEVLRPAVSAWGALVANAAAGAGVQEDIHAYDSGLSRACFAPVVEEANRTLEVSVLGLRAEESRGRRANRALRGVLYPRRGLGLGGGPLWVSQPLADWKGVDVYAYAAAHEVPLFPVYRCIALMHRQEPWRLRMDWWWPGAHAARGGMAWLRRYYPGLYRQALSAWPEASMYA